MAADRSFEERLPEALATTGFVVEHEVAEAFRAAKWGVIGSRYYIDDVDGRAREIDLVVYKVSHGDEIDVVTSVLISCKKDRDNVWAVMSRGRPTQDPNLDWNPVQEWTNNHLLGAYLGSIDWSEEYVRGDQALYANLFEISRQAFAFQLVSMSSCKPNNDRPIFQSLTDLMKAQDHELSILPGRMKKNRVYTFSLLAIVDTQIYEVRYDSSPPSVSKIDEFRHLARYIVNRHDRVSRVNIRRKQKLPEIVGIYDALAQHDCAFFNDKIRQGFAAIKTNNAVQKSISKELTKTLKFNIHSALFRNNRNAIFPEISISFDKLADELLLEIDVDGPSIPILMQDAKLMEQTQSLLIKHGRYRGKFRYEVDIPF